MSLVLDPPELGFRRPFTHEVSQILVLKNPNSDPVAFKVKTTAPKQYCVRPNSGRIEAGHEVKVQVLLQAMKEDPPPDAKCRDKFLVQSVAVTADKEFSNVPSIWQHVDKAAKSSVEETKIKVVFLPAEGDSTQAPYPGATNGDARSQPPAYRSATPDAVTPHHTIPASLVPPPESRPSDPADPEAAPSTANPTTSSDDKTVTSTDTVQDLRNQLEKAHAEIARLLNEKSGQGLRQRKTDAVNQDVRERVTAGTAGLGVQQQPIEGVSVQIVAALCLLSFLLAYLFF
ncbi:hypothetical protein FGG08_001899 [Glutinoglossum americanum]|uniref:MSP domain-containing protein n=1 Tax=Glutinoglossum americanum TaxID=1670608 RepID=A0A9P8L2A4_9PEZI|nr:hypothetical protein FGG08_001899 [Glutinoglossum americanum]